MKKLLGLICLVSLMNLISSCEERMYKYMFCIDKEEKEIELHREYLYKDPYNLIATFGIKNEAQRDCELVRDAINAKYNLDWYCSSIKYK